MRKECQNMYSNVLETVKRQVNENIINDLQTRKCLGNFK